MKKFLSFVIGFVCVSIGAWADGTGYTLSGDTWCEKFPTLTETAVKVDLTQEGALQSALDEINTGVTKVVWVTDPSSGQSVERTIALKDCNIIFISGPLGNADLSALTNLNYETIVLEDVTWNVSSKNFTNSKVKYLILPDGWTKEEVNDIGRTMAISSANFGSCLSQDEFNEEVCGYAEPVVGATVTAYVHTGNTLYYAIRHTFIDRKANERLAPGGLNQNNMKMILLKGVTISGYPVARDMFAAELDYKADGHIAFNEPADETRHDPQDDSFMGISGNKRVPVGDGVKEYGALENCDLFFLDLEDAIIPEEYNEDLTLGMSGSIGKSTIRVIIPKSEVVQTLPADFLNVSGTAITQICIPANIKYIKARAFQHVHLYHVWTSPMKGKITDYGIVTAIDAENNETRQYGYVPYNSCDKLYGSITLPPYLELIESGAFQMATEIKDVYSLNPYAPECHVDAFNTLEYVANDSYNKTTITTEGIVTRDAYTNANYKWMTLLHYPRESEAPHIQRYTDPTRRYSIASGDKDGNGATIYYPNQSEYCRAYLQGTTGYLWNSWDTTREEYNNGFDKTTIESDLSKSVGYTDERQDVANATYEANQLGLDTKKLTSFYDVTEGGKVSQPNGLVPYSTVYWDEASYSLNTEGRGVPLYPAAKYSEEYFKYEPVSDPSTFTGKMYEKVGDEYVEVAGTIDEGKTYYSRVQTQAINEDGSLKYEACADGGFVIDGYNYVAADNGGFVREEVVSGYAPTTKIVEGVANYYSDSQGQRQVTPKVGSGMYFEDGTNNVYSTDPVYAPVVVNGNVVTTYYTKSGDTYTESPMYFHSVKYHSPVTGPVTTYTATNKIEAGKTLYTSDDGSDIVATDLTFVNNLWNNPVTIYYKDGDTYYQTEKYNPAYSTYYVRYSYSQPNVYEEATQYLTFTTNAYYKVTETKTTYSQTDQWIPSVTTYYSDENGTVYYNGTGEWPGGAFKEGYYYVTGTTPKYSSAQGEDYDASITYYSDQNGTVATEINLNDTYYIPEYSYTYREYTSADGDVQQWKQVPYYREVAEGETGTYCKVMVDAVFRDLLKKNDYRGWHQFVLVANASNSDVPFESLKSFVTDNDWWTICVPYDLTYSDMVYLFGDKKNNKIPYLSKLLYVVRDVKNTHITLMFSKNLMEYKEQFLPENGSVTGFEQFPDPSTGKTSGRVHGYIDESETGKWSDDEINRNPVILHAGVPYMIRPEIPVGGPRQFDIYRQDMLTQEAQASLKPNAIVDDGLWARLNEARNLSGDVQKQLVYNGEYQVPAYVINNTDNSERTKGNNGVTITMNDGSNFTYPALNGETEETQFLFKNNRYKMEISDVFDYTFVGTFYKSLMPQYSYFLGWNPNATNRYGQKGAAAFWYNRVNDVRNWNWNNETGVICANWSLDKEIEKASAAQEILPARWVAEGGTDLANDDFTVGSSTSQNARGYMPWTFDNGMKILIDGQDPEDVVSEGDGVPDAINNVNAESKDGEWYNVNGQKLNRKPVTNGVYIKNGKKYVVK